MNLPVNVEGFGDQKSAGPCAMRRGTLRQFVEALRGRPLVTARLREGAQSFSENVSTMPASCIASLPAVSNRPGLVAAMRVTSAASGKTRHA